MRISALSFVLILCCAPFSTGLAGDTLFTVRDVSWIAGSWQGTLGESFIEERWTEPEGSNMTGMFRIVNDGQPSLFEFMSMQEADHRVTLSIKHFNGDMTGWEEKDESTVFTLVKLNGTAARFDHAEEGKSLTYEREGEAMVITLRELRGGKPATIPFNFRLVP